MPRPYPWESRQDDGTIVLDYDVMKATLSEWEAQLEKLDAIETFTLTPENVIELLELETTTTV